MPKFINKKHKTLSSKKVFDNPPWFEIRKDEVLLPNGKKIPYSYMKTNGGVAVIPITSKGEIVLVKQFRYLFQKPMLEIIMGGRKNLTSLRAAKAELAEEAKLQARTLKKVGQCFPANGSLKESIDVYLATQLSPYQKEEDVSEFIVPVKKKIKTVYEMAENGKIKCGISLAALMLAKKYLL
jgi:ADP-ribose pyrophosphatase